jgi:hypothetical protein
MKEEHFIANGKNVFQYFGFVGFMAEVWVL